MNYLIGYKPSSSEPHFPIQSIKTCPFVAFTQFKEFSMGHKSLVKRGSNTLLFRTIFSVISPQFIQSSLTINIQEHGVVFPANRSQRAKKTNQGLFSSSYIKWISKHFFCREQLVTTNPLISYTLVVPEYHF